MVSWLLDRGPADLRTSALRRHPLALASYVGHYVDACVEGARMAYARARSELGAVLDPADLSVVQQALEAEGARLLTVQREVRMVSGVMRNRAEPGASA